MLQYCCKGGDYINTSLVLENKELEILNKLGTEVISLQKTLPTNSKGLPTAYIDAQTVLEQNIKAGNPSNIHSTSIELDYLEGYPVVNGLPFWEKLDGEPIDYYKVFKYYRDSKETKGVRSFKDTSEHEEVNLKVVTALAKVYLWKVRVKSFDFYKEQIRETIKHNEIRQMEDRHTKTAENLFQLASDRIENILKSKEEGIKILTSVKDLVTVTDLAIKLERISRGLPSDKPMSEEEKQNAVGTVINNLNLSQENNEVNNNNNNNVNITPADLQETIDTLVSSNYIKASDTKVEVLDEVDDD